MSEKKKMSEWEKELGMVIYGQEDDNELSLEEFKSLAQENGYLYVDHKSRVKFLKDNGYEVSRENILNTELSCVKKEAVQEEEEV